MKFLRVIISLLLLLVVESSSSTSDNFMNNIPRGSSLSLNDPSPYWLSPSGNIAFGFHQLPWSPGQYVVGIWFVKSPRKTLVWTANRYDLPLQKPLSSIHFTSEGKLMLQIMPDNKEKPLIPEVELASYAMMQDDGNFVLYGSDSQIVWESFDHPTDTILGGQKLDAGVDLISGGCKLSVQQSHGLVAIYNMNSFTYTQGYRIEEIVEEVVEVEGPIYSPITLNLDTYGNLYLHDGVYYYHVYQNKNQQRNQQEKGSILEAEEEVYIYRATLDPGGYFSLYKERIDGNMGSADHDEKFSSTAVRLWPKSGTQWSKHTIIGLIIIGVQLSSVIGLVYCCILNRSIRRKA